MKIARIICWQLDWTLRPTSKRGFDIIPAQPQLISDLESTDSQFKNMRASVLTTNPKNNVCSKDFSFFLIRLNSENGCPYIDSGATGIIVDC
jgi:hypothetical protein